MLVKGNEALGTRLVRISSNATLNDALSAKNVAFRPEHPERD